MKGNVCSAGLRQRTAQPGEVYAFYIEILEKYGVCQILAVEDKSRVRTLLCAAGLSGSRPSEGGYPGAPEAVPSEILPVSPSDCEDRD